MSDLSLTQLFKMNRRNHHQLNCQPVNGISNISFVPDEVIAINGGSNGSTVPPTSLLKSSKKTNGIMSSSLNKSNSNNSSEPTLLKMVKINPDAITIDLTSAGEIKTSETATSPSSSSTSSSPSASSSHLASPNEKVPSEKGHRGGSKSESCIIQGFTSSASGSNKIKSNKANCKNKSSKCSCSSNSNNNNNNNNNNSKNNQCNCCDNNGSDFEDQVNKLTAKSNKRGENNNHLDKETNMNQLVNEENEISKRKSRLIATSLQSMNANSSNIIDEEDGDDDDKRLQVNGNENENESMVTSATSPAAYAMVKSGINQFTTDDEDGSVTSDGRNDPLRKYNHEILMRQMSSAPGAAKVELIWQNMSFELKPSKWKKVLKNFKQSVLPDPATTGVESDSEFDDTKDSRSSISDESKERKSKNIIRKARKRTKILQSQNGMISGGTLTALMGPSGAGKTTLLNCITGKVKQGRLGTTLIRLPAKGSDCNGNSPVIATTTAGEIFHATKAKDNNDGKSSKNKAPRIRIGFVPQHDHLLPQFSVRESLLFASKMNNPSHLSKAEHEVKVEQLMIALKLTTVADQRVSRLSGGQLKRTSIGSELISSPEVLILDEPTSGLDSDNSLNIVAILRSLCKTCSTAIIATIHQPSIEIFYSFHSIYLLSIEGANIYYGPPALLPSYLAQYGYNNTKASLNPADYAIQVANGKYGVESLEKMAEDTRNAFTIADGEERSMMTLSVEEAESRKPMHSGFKQFYYLMSRVIQQNVTKTHDLLARTLLALILGALICTMFIEPIGKVDGCWLDHLNQTGNETEEQAVKRYFFEAIAQSSSEDAEGWSIISERSKLLDQLSGMVTNGIFIFIQALFSMIAQTVGTVLTLPIEMQTVCKELSNSWYSVSAYFLARTFYDSITVIIINTPVSIYLYWITEQIPVFWRFMLFYGLGLLFSQVCHAIGVLFGISFESNIIMAIVMATSSLVPVAAFAGLIVPLNKMPTWMQPMAYLSHLKYVFEGALLAIYGFGRCEGGLTSQGLLQSLTSLRNPVRLVGSLWNSFNITSDETRRLSTILGLPSKTYLDPIVEALNDYFHNVDDDSDGDDEELYQPSFMLDFFGFYEENLPNTILALVLMFLVYRILAYVILVTKVKEIRLS